MAGIYLGGAQEKAQTVRIAATAGGGIPDGIPISFGSEFPESHEDGDVFWLRSNATLNVALSTITLIGETNFSDRMRGEVNIDRSRARAGFQTIENVDAFLTLDDGDQIVLLSDTGQTVVMDLSGAPEVWSTGGFRVHRNNYTLTGAVVDEKPYTIYAVKSRDETNGAIFESDGFMWSRLREGS